MSVNSKTSSTRSSLNYSYSILCKEHLRPTNALPEFSRKEPRSPLLKSTPDDELDNISRIWRIMFRFMSGVTDSNSKAVKSSRQKNAYPPVMSLLRQELSKPRGHDSKCLSTSDMPGSDQGQDQQKKTNILGRGASESKAGSRKLKQSLKKKLSLPSHNQSEEEGQNLEDILQSGGLDQIQFIIGFGILKPNLRDEIFCMILRQLTNNTMKTGRARLWDLLNLMIGVYPPSDKIFPYVSKFIEEGSSVNSSQMKKLIKRVQQNGARFQPPSKVEYQAVMNQSPIELQVTLMNGINHSICSDPCTTSAEVIRAISDEIELEETFGFSLFIVMENRISSLGSTGDKVFDSISQCEQVHRTNALTSSGSRTEEAPWRLFIRKELFSPWDDITGRPASTNLVYSQIVRGIMLGEYVCERDVDLAAVAAMQYYVDFENDVTEENLYASIPFYVPPHKLIGEGSVKIWCKQVAIYLNKMITFYAKSDDDISGRTPADVKAELVAWAKRKWPKSFSRYFDVRRIEGPRWDSDNLILGVNSKGVSLSTIKGDAGLDVAYPQISSVVIDSAASSSKSDSSVLTMVFGDGILIKLESADVSDIHQLITSNIGGLLKRSTWAVAKQEFLGEMGAYLNCMEGDLIALKSPADKQDKQGDGFQCKNMATEEEGIIKTSLLHILPCIEQPNDDILRLFRGPKYYTQRSAVNRTRSNDESTEGDEEEEKRSGAAESSEVSEREGDHPVEFYKRPVSSLDNNLPEIESIYINFDEEYDQEKTDKDAESVTAMSSIGFDKDFFDALSLFRRDGLIEENSSKPVEGSSSFV